MSRFYIFLKQKTMLIELQNKFYQIILKNFEGIKKNRLKIKRKQKYLLKR